MKPKKIQVQTQDVVVIKKEIAPIVQTAISLVIDSPKQMEKATETLSQLNTFIKRIKEIKNEVLIPAKLVVKNENARWEPVESMYNEGIEQLRVKMGDYQTEQTRIEDEKKAKIAERVAPGRGNFSYETGVRKQEEVKTAEKKIVTDSGIVKFRTVPKLKITDSEQIPRKYLIIDESAVLLALKAGIAVPGAEIEIRQVPVNSQI